MHTKFGSILGDNYFILKALFYVNPEQWNCAIFARFSLCHVFSLSDSYYFVASDFNMEIPFQRFGMSNLYLYW